MVMGEPPVGIGPEAPPPIPLRVIPAADLPIFQAAATALTRPGGLGDTIPVGVTKTRDIIGGEDPSQPATQVEVAFSGANPQVPAEEGDIVSLDEVVQKALDERAKWARLGFEPDTERSQKGVESAIGNTAAPIRMRRQVDRQEAEKPGKLAALRADADRANAATVQRGLRDLEALRERQKRGR